MTSRHSNQLSCEPAVGSPGGSAIGLGMSKAAGASNQLLPWVVICSACRQPDSMQPHGRHLLEQHIVHMGEGRVLTPIAHILKHVTLRGQRPIRRTQAQCATSRFLYSLRVFGFKSAGHRATKHQIQTKGETKVTVVVVVPASVRGESWKGIALHCRACVGDRSLVAEGRRAAWDTLHRDRTRCRCRARERSGEDSSVQ